MAVSLHQEKVNAEVKRALSIAIREIQDPRLSAMVSVSEAQVSKDMKHAKVWVSIYDTPEAQQESLAVLAHASGMLKSRLSKLVRMRRVPDLHFELDRGMEYSAHINDLINSVHTTDETEEIEDGEV